ncbi:MAG: HAD family phosphatase [Thomasclavelia sp.]|jgi:HAD superfamily hydrolase (TIGR01509 family)|nr:HAD family phosphatase [Thomasclavelia sp.]
MLKVKGVIFDMDGLMIDSEKLAYKTNIIAAKKYGYELPEAVAINLMGRNLQDSFKYLEEVFGKDYPAQKIRDEAVRLRYEHYEVHPIEAMPGLYELIDYLKSKNIKMAVASSTRKARVIEQLTTIKVIDDIDYIVGGDEEPKGKPEPDIFLNALKGLNISNEDALVLEDSKNGILAANNANINVICIPDVVKHPQNICDLTYKTLNSLKDVIEEIE